MIAYEVTVEVEPGLAQAYIAYMRDRHIPDLMGTGCFTVTELHQSGVGTFRQRYLARDQASLDRYLANHAPAFRFDFQQHFPDGARISRAVWRELGRWSRPSAT